MFGAVKGAPMLLQGVKVCKGNGQAAFTMGT